MTRQRQEWLLVETSQGQKFLTQKHVNGTITWMRFEEEVADEARKLLSQAIIVASSECGGRGVTVGDMKKFHTAEVCSSTSDSELQSYAQRAFEFASGKSLQEPPDAKGEMPLHKTSHSGGCEVDFSLDAFQDFDPSRMRVDPVEPIDSLYQKFGGRCLVLRNVLSPAECQYLIQEMSRDMQPVQYRHDYRSNERCIFNSPELAELLYRRVEPVASQLAVCVGEYPLKQCLFTPDTQHEENCPEELHVGYNREGVWYPVGLNECLRFCKYNPGDFFRKHCDAMFERSEDERSLFTCMFYLNGDFEGGATRFLRIDDRSGCISEQYKLAPDEEVLASIDPEPGLCILFFQPGLLHEGEDLYSGEKFILRSDMLFRRDPTTKPERTEQQVEAARLVEQAAAAEARKECDLACSLYRRAFKLDPKLERLF
mmetsp:Transcript_157952/g.278858  ORF Transcript_157952/g.278858 Transcript_157952/m.278858 type:complete len:427 (-) Transcript_157952:80-1360(-)